MQELVVVCSTAVYPTDEVCHQIGVVPPSNTSPGNVLEATKKIQKIFPRSVLTPEFREQLPNKIHEVVTGLFQAPFKVRVRYMNHSIFEGAIRPAHVLH